MINDQNNALELYKEICKEVLCSEHKNNISLLLSEKAVQMLMQKNRPHTNFLPNDLFLIFIDFASKNKVFNLKIQVVENTCSGKLFEIKGAEHPRPRLNGDKL